ncbi:MAG TPA: prepilin-type N-terminal cleavage/methylation domain-containing protein [Candidatus Saccharimonadales bacterium]|nr:prepilin-type N-terminal cleavage/methylation domain-containing protein [Candidatus Saccharimonadales bacterium]
MTLKQTKNGFSVIEVLIAILVVIILAAAGYFAWQKTKKDDDSAKKSTTNTSQTDKKDANKSNTVQTADPTEGGKYLYIKEWGVRAALPADLHGKVSYQLGDKTSDPDGNLIQAAKILLMSNSDADNSCAVVTTSSGTFIEAGVQYIQSEVGKAFNASRYKWTFKEDILTDASHDYHLNYVTPDCASASAVTEIEQLQTTLEDLQKAE